MRQKINHPDQTISSIPPDNIRADAIYSRKPLLSVHAMTLCSLFTALITVGAFLRIPFPIVPITLQTLFVVLAALLLGPKYSLISVGMYLFLGLAGLPIFTKGGGPGYVLQPTFGYLLGFLAACWVMGVLAKKVNAAVAEKRGVSVILRYWAVGMAGIAVVYLVGMVYLAFIMKFYMNTPVGFVSLFTVNFLLTAGGDVFKCLVAALLAARLLPVLRRSSKFWA